MPRLPQELRPGPEGSDGQREYHRQEGQRSPLLSAHPLRDCVLHGRPDYLANNWAALGGQLQLCGLSVQNSVHLHRGTLLCKKSGMRQGLDETLVHTIWGERPGPGSSAQWPRFTLPAAWMFELQYVETEPCWLCLWTACGRFFFNVTSPAQRSQCCSSP